MMKYKPIALALGLITSLWVVRCIVDGTVDFYWFMVPNAILAVIPLLIEPLFVRAKKHLKGLRASLAKYGLAAVWLLFIPNAFYILTDFMHLNAQVLVNSRNDNTHYPILYSRGDGLYMLDSLMIFAATLFGAYVGGLALLHAYRYFKRHTLKLNAQIITGLIMLLSGIGIYIGRYDRWNSWQGLTHPFDILTDLGNTLSKEHSRNRFLIVVFTSFIFEFLCVAYVAYAVRNQKNKR